jgi:hypothetical protein
MTDRPMMELDFVMFIVSSPLPVWAEEYRFPLAVFEDPTAAMLLIPVPHAMELLDGFPAILRRLAENVAYVTIPYHPPAAEDDAIYGFGVHLSWIPNSQAAIGEMLMLELYSRTLYDRYRVLATPFEV